MSDHQRETAFLRQCIRYDDTEERHRLEERITESLRDERCVRRAMWLMALLAMLAMAGLGYAAVFMADHPQNMSQFVAPLTSKGLAAPFRVPLTHAGTKGLIVLDQIRSVDKVRLGKRLGAISAKTLSAALVTLQEMFAE